MVRPHPNVRHSNVIPRMGGKRQKNRSKRKQCWRRTKLFARRLRKISFVLRTFRLFKTRPSSRDAFEVSWPFMTWPTLLFGLFLASVAGWVFTAYTQTRRIRALERSHEEIQVEETLVFDFLHGLGEDFIDTIRPNELHRLIVEGATRIL